MVYQVFFKGIYAVVQFWENCSLIGWLKPLFVMFVLCVCRSFQHSPCFPVHCFCCIVTSERLSVAAPFATALMAKVHLIKGTHTHSLLPSATYPLWWSAIQFVSQLQPSLLPKAHSSKWICLTFWPCSSLYDVCGLLGNNHLITTLGSSLACLN